MNIQEDLTCKCCNKIYKNPILLTCCGENICKSHVDDLILNKSTPKFACPLCSQENSNQNFHVNKIFVKLLNKELHKFELDPKYEAVLNSLKSEIGNLEAILKDPESLIYAEINELRLQVDLDREKLKNEIDNLADGLIKQLDSFKKRFNTEFSKNIDQKNYKGLVEASKKQLIEYEQCLALFSAKKEERDEKCNQSERLINHLQPKIKELKQSLFSNVSITYRPMQNNIKDFFGKLITKDISILEEKEETMLSKVKKELKAHNGSIYALAVLPNGDLVSGAEDNKIKIWDTKKGTVKQTLTGHSEYIWDLIAVDNQCLISASADRTIKVWSLSNEKVQNTLTGHSERVLALKMVNRDELASGSGDATIKIWNIRDGKLKRTLTGHSDKVWTLILLNNGDLVSGSSDSTIKIWNVETGTLERTLFGHTSHVYRLALLQNGDLVSSSYDKTIRVWDVGNESVKRTLIGHEYYVFALRVLGNGDLVSGSSDGVIKVWDAEKGTVKKDIVVNSRINSFEVLPNGNLVSASNRSIIIWE